MLVAATDGCGLIVTVTLVGAEEQPAVTAVIMNVVICAVFVALVSVPSIRLPGPPLNGIPVSCTLSVRVQLYTVLGTLLGLLSVMVEMGEPEHAVTVPGVTASVGDGFMVTVKVRAGPVQPLMVALTVTVVVIAEMPDAIVVKAGISPVPIVPKPTSVVLVQL